MSEYLLPSQVARMRGVSVTTVNRWVDSGTLPGAIRTAGGQRRIPRAAVEQLALTTTVAPSTGAIREMLVPVFLRDNPQLDGTRSGGTFTNPHVEQMFTVWLSGYQAGVANGRAK